MDNLRDLEGSSSDTTLVQFISTSSVGVSLLLITFAFGMVKNSSKFIYCLENLKIDMNYVIGVLLIKKQ